MSFLRIVSPAPPSNNTLSGSTTGGSAIHFEQCLDVLHEIEPLVRRGCPEVVALDHVFLGRALAVSPFDLRAALLADGGLARTI
jgi:hypothetical protein